MFDLGLFRNPTFVGSSVSAFAVCFSVLALIFFLTTWLQSILGYSAVGTGLRMLVFTGAALMFAPLAGRMSGSVSPRIVLPLGLALVTGGVLSMTAVSASSSWTAILPGLVLTGIGLGLMNPTLASTAVSRRAAVARRDGLGDEQHLPRGRDRRGHRRRGNAAPAPGARQRAQRARRLAAGAALEDRRKRDLHRWHAAARARARLPRSDPACSPWRT